MNVEELNRWRDHHRLKASEKGKTPSQIKFHRQAVADITVRIDTVKLLSKYKLKGSFNWEKFCALYRPKTSVIPQT